MAASGALTSALRLVTKAAFEKYKNGLCHGTMLFLAISTCFEFICVILYAFYFPKLPIVKYYRSKAALEGSNTVSSDLATAAGIHSSEMKCYCYVCDSAAPCKNWSMPSGTHCHALDTEAWKEQRRLRRKKVAVSK